MSALVDRIAAVVAEHDDWFPNKDQTNWECDCGWQGKSHAAHVAEQVAAELQLTEEVGWMTSGKGHLLDRRWVSEWTAMEEQP